MEEEAKGVDVIFKNRFPTLRHRPSSLNGTDSVGDLAAPLAFGALFFFVPCDRDLVGSEWRPRSHSHREVSQSSSRRGHCSYSLRRLLSPSSSFSIRRERAQSLRYHGIESMYVRLALPAC